MKLFHEEKKLDTILKKLKKLKKYPINEINTGEFKATLVSNPQRLESNDVKYLATEIDQNLDIDQLDHNFGKIINNQMNVIDLQSLYFLNTDIICKCTTEIIDDLLRESLYKQWAIGANF